MLRVIYFTVIFGTYLWGCSESDSVSYEELQQFLLDEDNGLTKTRSANGVRISVSYFPTDVIVFDEVAGSMVDSLSMTEMRAKYVDYYYFQLRLSRNNKEVVDLSHGGEHYSRLLQALSFRMNDYTTLRSDDHSEHLADFVLDRTFGLADATSMILVFGNREFKGDRNIVLHLREFGLGTGDQTFSFSREDMSNVPSIKFELVD